MSMADRAPCQCLMIHTASQQVATNVLSHSLDTLALVTAWLLFFVGLTSLLLGLIFGTRIKLWRSFSPKDRAAALLYPTRRPWTVKASTSKDVEAGLYKHPNRPTSHLAGAPLQVRTLSEAFGGHRQKHFGAAGPMDLSPSYEEVMRAHAREANERAERQQEQQRQASCALSSSRILSGGFVYDSQVEGPIAVGCPNSRASDLSRSSSDRPSVSRQASVKSTVHHHHGRFLAPCRQPDVAKAGQTQNPLLASRTQSTKVAPPTLQTVSSTVPLKHETQRAKNDRAPRSFQRRSLALTKAARKRSSTVSTTSNSSRHFKSSTSRRQSGLTSGRSSAAVPAMPSLTQRRLHRAVERQAERERDRLRRLAAELKLGLVGSFTSFASPGPSSQHQRLPPSPSAYSVAEDKMANTRPTTRRPSFAASTAVLTSVSRRADRYGHDRDAEEEFLATEEEKTKQRQEQQHRYRESLTADVPTDANNNDDVLLYTPGGGGRFELVGQPCPAYQPSALHRTHVAPGGGEHLGLERREGGLNRQASLSHSTRRLPIAGRYESEWGARI